MRADYDASLIFTSADKAQQRKFISILIPVNFFSVDLNVYERRHKNAMFRSENRVQLIIGNVVGHMR